MNANRLWLIGTALAVIVILVAGYFLGVAPKLAQAGASALQVQQAQGQNQAQQATLDQLEGQYKNIGTLRAKLAALQLSVPSNADGEDFLTEINTAMKTSQTTLDSITLAEPVPFATGSIAAPTTTGTTPDAGSTATPAPTATAAAPTTVSGGTSDAATAPTPAAGAAYTVAVIITVEGSPDQVFQFDNLMQNGSRLFLPTTVAFQSQNASATGAGGSSASGSGGGSGGQSSQGGVLTGYLFVVSGTDVEPTPTSTPAPSGTSIPTTTPTPTDTPKP
jgi:hypothetical protein